MWRTSKKLERPCPPINGMQEIIITTGIVTKTGMRGTISSSTNLTASITSTAVITLIISNVIYENDFLANMAVVATDSFS